jgi:tetratricopeptide (TPR) repeat protein
LAGESADRLEVLIGEPHSRVVSALSYLGLAATQAGNPVLALDAHHRALEMSRRLTGDGRTRGTAMRCNNLAFALQEMGRLTDALPLAKEALEITRAVGASSSSLSLRLNRVGTILSAIGTDDEEAEWYLREAVAVIGPGSSRRVYLRVRGLCQHLCDVGRPVEAEQLLDNALAAFTDPRRPRDVILIPLLRGEILTVQGRSDEAHPLLEEALSNARRVRDVATLDVARCLVSLASCLAAAGDHRRARTFALEAATTYRFWGVNEGRDLRRALTLAGD